MSTFKFWVLLCLLFSHENIFANPESIPSSPLPAFHREDSPFGLRKNPEHPRSVFVPQLISYVLPGFDQYLESQWDSGLIYSGTGFGGLYFAANQIHKMGTPSQAAERVNREAGNGYASRDNLYRGYLLGNQIYGVAGGFSAYHSFRTAVRSRQPYGEFTFLQEEETVSDLLVAPLHFQFLARPTTWVPLLIGIGLAYWENTPGSLAANNQRSKKLTGPDVFFGDFQSFNAGTYEEALFRGWLFPLWKEYLQSDLLANSTNALLFALAHANIVKVPIAQAILGFHLGNVVMDNHWTLSEAVFIHTWWDVISFLSVYSSVDKAKKTTSTAAVMLLPLQFHF